MRTAIRGAASGGVLLCVLPFLTGCGDQGGKAPGTEVLMRATIQTGPFAITGLTLTTADPDDSFGASGATARVERPDGTSDAVALDVSPDHTMLTLGPATLAPDTAAQGTAQADVPVLATFDVTQPGQVDRVVVRATDPGDTFDVSGVTAEIDRPDGTSAPVSLTINADQNEITLGSFATAPQMGTYWRWKLNTLRIIGPVGVKDGPSGSEVRIGSLEFSIAAATKQDLVVPTSIRACIPTLGAPSDPRVVVEGLTPQDDYAWISILDSGGGMTYSRARLADANGRVVLPDTLAQFTADRISGPNTRIEMCVASTKRYPPVPVYPPYAPGGGGGPGEGRSLDDLNVIVIEGPIAVRDGSTGSQVRIGGLRFGFQALGDGTVIAPASISWALPTQGAVRTPPARLTGLQPGDCAQVMTIDKQGYPRGSSVARAGSGGEAVVRNALRNLSSAMLSGSDTSVAFFFWRTAP